MLQRVWLTREHLDPDLLVQSTETTFVQQISDAAQTPDTQTILDGLLVLSEKCKANRYF